MDWLPRLIDWLVRRATAKLPEDDQVRFGEEWRSHVNDVSESVEKVYVAVGFNIAARRLASRERQRLIRADSYKLSTEYDDLHFELSKCCPSLEGDAIVAVIDLVVVDKTSGNVAFLAATIHRISCPNHCQFANRSLVFRSRTPGELAFLDSTPPKNGAVVIF